MSLAASIFSLAANKLFHTLERSCCCVISTNRSGRSVSKPTPPPPPPSPMPQSTDVVDHPEATSAETFEDRLSNEYKKTCEVMETPQTELVSMSKQDDAGNKMGMAKSQQDMVLDHPTRVCCVFRKSHINIIGIDAVQNSPNPATILCRPMLLLFLVVVMHHAVSSIVGIVV